MRKTTEQLHLNLVQSLSVTSVSYQFGKTLSTFSGFLVDIHVAVVQFCLSTLFDA